MINMKSILTLLLLPASAMASYMATGIYYEAFAHPVFQHAAETHATETHAHGTMGAIPASPAELYRMEGTIYFDPDQTTLSPAMKARLDKMAEVLRLQTHVKSALVVGYADSRGQASVNRDLSKARAETVKRYLIAEGLVDAGVTNVRWLGASAASGCEAVQPGDKPACLQQGRRVEIEIDYKPNIQAAANF